VGLNSARIIPYTCHSEREINWSDIVNVDISLTLLETGIAAGGYKTVGAATEHLRGTTESPTPALAWWSMLVH